MGFEAQQYLVEKPSQDQSVDIHAAGENEYESLINSTTFDAQSLYTPGLTELLKGPATQPAAAVKVPALRDGAVVAISREPSEQEIEDVLRHLEAHPERVTASVIKALGEHLIIDAANDASVLSRTELDKKLKENPEISLFTRLFIDRIGISQGYRWVPDKDVAAAVQEALLAKHSELSKGRFQRAFDVLMGRDANLFKALTEQVEDLYAAKLAVERDIQQQKAILASTMKEIEQREAESQFRLLEENKKIVVEQIARQEKLILDLKEAQDEIARVREQQSQEVIAHQQRMNDLESEYQHSRSKFSAQTAELESSVLQKQLESQIALNNLTANLNEAETKAQMKIAALESQFRISELELQAKLGASEARFEERKADIRTQISVLTSEHNQIRIAKGIKPEANTSLEEFERNLVDQIQNMVLFKSASTVSDLYGVIYQSLATLVEVDEVLGADSARLLARRIQNEIGEMFKDAAFNLKLDMIKLLSCPDFSETQAILESLADDRDKERKLFVEVMLHLERFGMHSTRQLPFYSRTSLGTRDMVEIDEYRILRKLASQNNVTVDALVGGLVSSDNNYIDRVNLTELMKAGISNFEALKEFQHLQFVDIESGLSGADKVLFASALKCLPSGLKYTVNKNALMALAQNKIEIKDLTIRENDSNFRYVTTVDMLHITKIVGIERLIFKNAKVSDSDLEQLSKLPALKSLEVHSFSGADPYAEIVKFPVLEEVSLHLIDAQLRSKIQKSYIKVLAYRET